MFKKRSPNSASNIQPQYTEEMQTFSVDLYDPQIGKLDQPVDLERQWVQMGKRYLQLRKEKLASPHRK